MVGSQQFSVAENSDLDEVVINDIHNADSVMSNSVPDGATPLTRHILEIQRYVKKIAPKLKKDGKRVSIVLTTDGLPTNECGSHDNSVLVQFIEALRLMVGLPVWVVVRLCTGEIKVFGFENYFLIRMLTNTVNQIR